MDIATLAPGRSSQRNQLILLDRAHLVRVTLGSSALAREVLDLFVDQVPVQIEALASALPGRPWFEAAHGLKGSARAIGALALAEVAAEAETVAAEASDGRRRELLATIRAIADETFAVVMADPT